MNKKIVVGMLPQVVVKDTNIIYDDRNLFVNRYSELISESGADLIGLISVNNKISEDVLDLCDAFFIQGGTNIDYAYFDVINYAIKHNKPLLGVCLGMQAISLYSMFVDDSSSYNREDFISKYNKYKEEHNNLVLDKIDSSTVVHNTFITNDTYKESFHKVYITDTNSHIYDIYKHDVIDEASLHTYTPSFIGSEFKITAKAEDNIVEAVEYNKEGYFILGVQFHPEFDEPNLIFKKLVEEGFRRKYE